MYSFSNRSFVVFALAIFAFPIQAAHNINGKQVIRHVQMLQELKEKHAEKSNSAKEKPASKKSSMTQSDAHWRQFGPAISAAYPNWFANYQTIIDTCLARERELVDTHYVLYHGQKSELCILQDVLKLLYETLHIRGSIKNFELMRAWHDALEKMNIDNYLASGKCDSKDYFCVNLSLFGNHINAAWNGSCTFHYFASNYNMSWFSVGTFLIALCDSLKLDKEYVSQILDLAKKIETTEGRLFQIFIPHDKIDGFVFLSQPGFVPYATPIVKQDYDFNLMRHKHISSILDLYKKNIASIVNADALQARVMCSKNLMLNPDKDIQVYMYSTIEEKKFQKYKKDLKQVVDVMLADWLTTQKVHAVSHSVTKEMPLVKLFEFIRHGR